MHVHGRNHDNTPKRYLARTEETLRVREKDANGKDVVGYPSWAAGDVIESPVDLIARFGPLKFERLHEPAPAPEPQQAQRRRAE